MAQENETEDEKHQNALYLEMGRFICAFAFSEAMVLYLLAVVARIPLKTSNAMVVGMRLADIINIVTRLNNISDHKDEFTNEISTLMEQLQHISAYRSVLVHYGASASGDQVLSTSLHNAKTMDSYQVWNTSIENLRAAIDDLDRIIWRIDRLLPYMDRVPFGGRDPKPFFAPWKYKPVQQEMPLKQLQSKIQKQQRRSRSSRA